MATRGELVEELVAKYGEKWRKIIYDALTWLDEMEPSWQLQRPISRRGFIDEIMKKAK